MIPTRCRIVFSLSAAIIIVSQGAALPAPPRPSICAARAAGPGAARRVNGPADSPLRDGDGYRKTRTEEAYGRLPLQFEANRGQANARFDFISRGSGYTTLLSPDEAVFILRRNGGQAGENRPNPRTLSMRLVGARADAVATPEEPLPGVVNYFHGDAPSRHRTGIPTSARVRYEGVYPGVDVVYYGRQRELEYDFIVAPGADADTVTLEFGGADNLAVGADGDLILRAGTSEVRMRKPFVYQDYEGGRRAVSAGYFVTEGRRVGFDLGDYDRTRPLVIDPVLSYSTFLGGSGGDWGVDIKVDAQGNAYVTGSTTSPNFPTTPNAIQSGFAGGTSSDVFVTKLNPSGTAALFSTYIGGSDGEAGQGIVLDSGGNIYVSGITWSTNYPTTTGAFQRTLANQDCFLTKLNAAGDALLYSTYLGGQNVENGADVAVDAAGDVYLSGSTYSTSFPTTGNALRTTVNPFAGHNFLSATDGFVAKIRPAGAGASDLIYSTYLGGNLGDGASEIAVDGAGFVYVTGATQSTNFPTTPDAFQPLPRSTDLAQRNGGASDAFLVKMDLSAAGAASLVYSTYLGGHDTDSGNGIALDRENNVYLAGRTTSVDFPATRNVLQPSAAGGADAYVVKLNPARPGQSGLVYATYLGGSAGENGADIAVDSSGNTYVTGDTRSTNLPVTVGAFQPSIGGISDVFSAPGGDAFAAKLNAAGTGLVYFTYLGGAGGDAASAITVDAAGNAYLTGHTFSINFPLTAGDFQPAHGGSFDAFVSRVDNPSSFNSTLVANLTADAVATERLSGLPNPIDDAQKFARQQYIDFLNREPDASGLAFWTSEITSCGSDAACIENKRVNVSAAFFLSIEFQETGYLVYRLYRAAYARTPRLRESSPDTVTIREGVVVNTPGWEQRLETNTRFFIDAWVQRPEFRARYDGKGNSDYVDELFSNTGVQPSAAQRAALIEGLANGAETRATVLRKIAENEVFVRQETAKAFVLMQYVGYFHRNPDDRPDGDLSGYNFWLTKLNNHGGNFVSAEMVKSFLVSGEYRRRFGQD